MTSTASVGYKVVCQLLPCEALVQLKNGQAIAQELGVSKTTVFNYLRSSTFTERRERSDQGLSLLNPYQDYLLSR